MHAFAIATASHAANYDYDCITLTSSSSSSTHIWRLLLGDVFGYDLYVRLPVGECNLLIGLQRVLLNLYIYTASYARDADRQALNST